MEYFGWIGSFFLAFCGLPQAIESFKTKSSEGITWGLLIMWTLGEIFTLIYIFSKKDLPLLLNYLMNIVFLSTIVYYKIWPGKK
jgi:uncharacterized protein with PQ loop repeat